MVSARARRHSPKHWIASRDHTGAGGKKSIERASRSDQGEGESRREAGSSWADKVKHLVPVLVAIDAIVMSVIGSLRYRAGLTHFYDLGVFDNIVWQAAHGRLFYYPQYQMSFFGDHFAPILFLLVPLYLVAAHPITLVITQNVALALGAIPLSEVVRTAIKTDDPRRPFASRVAQESVVVAVLLLYFANVALLHISLFDFHPIAFAIPLSLALYQAALSERWRRFWIMAVLLLACQEETGIGAVAFGLFLLLFGGNKARRRHGAILVAVAGVYLVIVMGVVIPAFQRTGGTPGWVYLTRYHHLGASMGQVLRTMFFHPITALTSSYASYKLQTLLQLLLPLGLLPLIGWRTSLVALPMLLGNYLSSREHQFQIQYQYFSTSLGWLFISLPWALRSIADTSARYLSATQRWLHVLVVALPLLLAGAATIYFDVTLRPIRSEMFAECPNRRQIEAVREIVGKSASISVTNNLGAYFSERPEIFLSLDFVHNRALNRALGLPNYHDSHFHLFDLSDLSGSDDREQRVITLLKDPQYGVRYLDWPIILFERGFPFSPLPLLIDGLTHERVLPNGEQAFIWHAADFSRSDDSAMVLRKDSLGRPVRIELLPGHRSTVYGPYATLPAGRYQAEFHLGLSGSAQGKVAAVDIATAPGGRVLRARAVDATALANGVFALDFALPVESKEVEFRTYVNGAGLTFDGVTVRRLLP